MVVVVVVVRTLCICDVSVHATQMMHLFRVAERLGASSRRPRHPFPALMAGVNPGRVPVHRALHETCSTCTTGTKTTLSMNCNWGSSMVCLNSQDQGNLPLRHDRDVNDLGERNEFVNEQELRENDCLIHNLLVKTCTTCIKGTSATVFINFGMPMVRRTVWPMGDRLCATKGMSTNLMKPFWSIPAVMPSITSLPKTEGNITRGAS